MDFKGKTVVITGAAGGFGSRLCKLFGERGARIEALDINLKSLAKLKKSLPAGIKIRTGLLNVADHEKVGAYGAKLARAKIYPAVWINNAGTAFPESFENTPQAVFQKTLDVNLNGVLNGTRAALGLMRGGGGAIVNIASVTGYIPCPFITSYSTSKFAVVGFTKGLQLELKHQGSKVKVILVSPGFADTAIIRTNKDYLLPKFFSWMIASPDAVARDIFNAVERGREEIFPGFNARAFLAIRKYTPEIFYSAMTRLMSARNFREMIGLENVRADVSATIT